MVARGSELLPQGPQDYLIVGSLIKDYTTLLPSIYPQRTVFTAQDNKTGESHLSLSLANLLSNQLNESTNQEYAPCD